MSHGKQYRNARAGFDREELYSPVQAIRLLKGFETAKFDESVEAHFNLGLNVRHAEQQLRGTLMLPHGTGRESRVAVFAEGDKAREAEEAGADLVGTADLAKQIEEGFDDFDVAVATPDQMSVVGKLGRILGPRGKMPNPKTGTVTMDVGRAVREAKAGKLEYRTDRGANVHVTIGKKSFDEKPARRKLRDADRRDHARQAGRGQGALRSLRYAYEHDGAGSARRPVPHERDRRRAGGTRARSSFSVSSPSPKTAGSSTRAEVQPRCGRSESHLVGPPACGSKSFQEVIRCRNLRRNESSRS